MPISSELLVSLYLSDEDDDQDLYDNVDPGIDDDYEDRERQKPNEAERENLWDAATTGWYRPPPQNEGKFAELDFLQIIIMTIRTTSWYRLYNRPLQNQGKFAELDLCRLS